MSSALFPFSPSTIVRRILKWKQGDEDDNWRSQASEILVKKLKKVGQQNYENITIAMRIKNENSPCAVMHRSQDGRVQVAHKKMAPHLMMCRLVRWPDLVSIHELRSTPSCQYPAHRRELEEICINPYHYNREGPPSQYPPIITTRDQSQSPQYVNASPGPAPCPYDMSHTCYDSQISLMGSSPLPAYTEQDSSGWCRITYYELNQRVGESFQSDAPVITVDGFALGNRRDKFSLGHLSNPNRNAPISNVRNVIREGICLENIDGQVYVTNKMVESIFFNSRNRNVEEQLNQFTVIKIKPGKREKMFDEKFFDNLFQEALRSNEKSYERLMSLVDHCVIKLSFVKGWGSVYHRQDVTSTPCWLEIHLLKYYELVDQYVQRTRPLGQITSYT